MIYDPVPPFRRDFDAARDPYTARVTLGLTAAATGGPFQPLDADLTALAGLTGVNVIYYRSAADTWSPVTIGTGLSFSGGTLSATAGAGPFVLKAGDTMTGDLTISKATPNINLTGTSTTQEKAIKSFSGAIADWSIFMGLASSANFGIGLYNALGTLVDIPFQINKTTAQIAVSTQITVGANPTSALQVATKQYCDTKIKNVVTQKFTANGSYTPTAGMVVCIVECQGGGGGGAGVPGAVGSCASGGGGGGGAFSKKVFSAAAIGASQTIVVGAAGNGGAAGANNGTAGGSTTFGGTLCTAPGGGGGFQFGVGASGQGGNGGTAGTGDLAIQGSAGTNGLGGNLITLYSHGGIGGASHFGGSPQAAANNTAIVAGVAGQNYGGGGNGGSSHNVATAAAGGNGAPGIVIITEFVA